LNMHRDRNIQYNADDFLLEIEHLNMQINNREQQMKSDTFKVTKSLQKKIIDYSIL
jgi:hypothetical protein